jgi:hypothetical protein
LRGQQKASAFCGAVAKRSNPTVGRAAFVVLAVAIFILAAGCAGGSEEVAAPTSTATTTSTSESSVGGDYGWTAATARRRVGGSSVTVGDRPMKVDPTTVVCWGAGSPERRGTARLWHRFDCLTSTFRGAQAGPDILFTLEPTGPTTFRVLNARFSSYGGG